MASCLLQRQLLKIIQINHSILKALLFSYGGPST